MGAQNCSNIEINHKNEIDHNMISRSELHPVYISSLLILVGFNFAAFSSFFVSSNVPVYHMMLATTAGICVALFLRKFIGLNLFKTRDKVSERAVLTIVTQKAIGSFLHYETMSGGSCFSELVSRLEKIWLGKNTRTNHRFDWFTSFFSRII